MAETPKFQFMTLENLNLYDELVKDYITTEDAKSLKTVAIVGNTLNFYRVEEPVGETAPAYSIELPETDLSNLIEKMAGTTEGHVVVANADGTIKDGGVALADLATKTNVGEVAAAVEAVEGKVATVEGNVTTLRTDVNNVTATANANKDDIVTLKGTGEGSVAKAVADAKTELNTAIDGVKADVAANAEAIEALNGTGENSIDGKIEAAVAEVEKELETVNTAVQAAQADADANATAIATLNGDATTEGSVAKAVADAKSELSAVDEALEGRVEALEDTVDKLDGDATVEGSVKKQIADARTAIEAQMTEADNALDGRLDTAEGDITAMKGQIAALEAGTYDDTEVRGLIQTNADDIDKLETRATELEARASALEDDVKVLVGDDADKSVRTIAAEELAKQLIPETAQESLDTLAEIAAWIQAHPDDASAMNKAIGDLEKLVGTIPEGATATDIVGYIQELVNAEKARAEAAEAGLDGRLDTIETNIGEGSVDSRIATAKSEAIAEAATDATSKADKALSDAKAYTDEKVGAIDLSGIDANADAITALQGRVDTAEKDIDDLLAAIDADGSVTVAIADAKKAGTDAQATADEAKAAAATAQSEVDALEVRVGANETAIAENAEAIAALEAIAGGGFEAIPEASIRALF